MEREEKLVWRKLGFPALSAFAGSLGVASIAGLFFSHGFVNEGLGTLYTALKSAKETKDSFLDEMDKEKIKNYLKEREKKFTGKSANAKKLYEAFLSYLNKDSASDKLQSVLIKLTGQLGTFLVPYTLYGEKFFENPSLISAAGLSLLGIEVLSDVAEKKSKGLKEVAEKLTKGKRRKLL